METAEFARFRGIAEEPTFRWLVLYTIKKKEVILSAIKCRVRKTTQKFGIKISQSVEEVYAIDKENGNHYWRDAIALELQNVGVAFELLDGEKQSLPR